VENSPALAIPTIQTSLTPIHQHQRLRIALGAQRRPRRKPIARFASGRLSLNSRPRLAHLNVFFCASLIRRTLLRDQALGRLVHLRVVDQADGLHVLLDHRADLGHDAGHVDAARLEVAAAGVEHRLHLFDQEGDVAALAEHGGDDAGERDDPLEVVHVLRVDEDLEGAALLVGRAGVEHDVVDGDVQRMLEQRRLDLVGGADQRLGTLQALVHLDDFRLGRLLGRGGSGYCGGRGLVLGLDDVVALDLLFDLDRHRDASFFNVGGRTALQLRSPETAPARHLRPGRHAERLTSSCGRPSWPACART